MMSLSRKYLLRFKRLLNAGVNATIYPLSSLSPRKSSHWVFGHQGGIFAGNSKYLFLWVTRNRPDIKAVWLTNHRKTVELLHANGYVAHMRWSISGMLAALRSKVFVYCHSLADVNLQLSRGSLRLNLWHGIGLKSTMLGDTGGVVSRHWKYRKNLISRAMFLDYLKFPDLVVTTSDFMQIHFAQQFKILPDQCPKLGYSRLDCAADLELKKQAVAIDRNGGFSFNAEGFSETYIYMPTYRDTGRPFLATALPDLQLLSKALAARSALLYIKLHPRTLANLPELPSNIQIWPQHFDFYTYLADFTGLITDYSSVIYDYIFLRNVGAILYTFDFDEFVGSDRALLYPYNDNIAGVRVSTFAQLCQVIEDGSSLLASENTAFVREKFWGSCVAPVSPNIVGYVEISLQQKPVSADMRRSRLTEQFRGLANSSLRRRQAANPPVMPIPYASSDVRPASIK